MSSGKIKPGRPLDLTLLRGTHSPLQLKTLESLHSILSPYLEWDSFIKPEGYVVTIKFYFFRDFEVFYEKWLRNPTCAEVTELYKEVLRAKINT